MATHSSVLAWRIPGTGEPDGLPDVYGVPQSRTRLKCLSSSSSSSRFSISTYNFKQPCIALPFNMSRLPRSPDIWGKVSNMKTVMKKRNKKNLRFKQNICRGTSMVVQWLRVCLSMQGTWVQSLVWEDPTCHAAPGLVCHNCWAPSLEPVSHNYWGHRPQPHAVGPSTRAREATTMRSPRATVGRGSPLTITRGNPHTATKTQQSKK